MNLEVALKKMGYTKQWLELGIITEKQLFEEYFEILESGDHNAEHCRSSNFYYYLNRQNSLSDKELISLINLKDNDAQEYDLSIDRILTLLSSSILSEKQLDQVAQLQNALDSDIQKRYQREKLIRRINSIGLNECFEFIKETSDPNIHRIAINHTQLKRKHIIWLSEHGCNKKIRNIANQKLNNKKYK